MRTPHMTFTGSLRYRTPFASAGGSAPARMFTWTAGMSSAGSGQVVGDGGRRVARGGDDAAGQRADGEALAVGEEVVELAAVAAECGLGVEDAAEGLLHGADPVADRDAPARLRLEIGRGGQM